MPRPFKKPPKFDNVPKIELGLQRKQGFFKSDATVAGVITWECRGQTSARITFRTVLGAEKDYCTLDYKYDDEVINYEVELEKIPSNLSTGNVYYFVCPRTGLRCRKLYLVGKYFLHRKAHTGAMYNTQCDSKKYREFDKLIGMPYKTDKYRNKIGSKHFKAFYKGRPTKRYSRLLKQITKADKLTTGEYNELMVSIFGAKVMGMVKRKIDLNGLG